MFFYDTLPKNTTLFFINHKTVICSLAFMSWHPDISKKANCCCRCEAAKPDACSCNACFQLAFIAG